MRKKFTLFLAVCMLAATSVSAATVTETKTQKEATTEAKTDSKEEVKDEEKTDSKDEAKNDKKDDSKDEVKDEEKDDSKDEAKDDKKDDSKDEVKDEEKDDSKDEVKDDKKDNTKDDVKDEKKAALTKEEFAAKAKDFKFDDIKKAVKDAYKAELTVLTECENSTVPGYNQLKADYATKEKVQEYLEKTLSSKYVEAFLKSDGKFKVIDEKCYVKKGEVANKCDFYNASVVAKEVKDDQVVAKLEVITNHETTTYKATFVYENDAWKVDSLAKLTETGIPVSILI